MIKNKSNEQKIKLKSIKEIVNLGEIIKHSDCLKSKEKKNYFLDQDTNDSDDDFRSSVC